MRFRVEQSAVACKNDATRVISYQFLTHPPGGLSRWRNGGLHTTQQQMELQISRFHCFPIVYISLGITSRMLEEQQLLELSPVLLSLSERTPHFSSCPPPAFSHDVIIYPILQRNAAWRFCTTSIINQRADFVNQWKFVAEIS